MGRKGRFETLVLPRLNDIADWYQTQTESQIAVRLGVAPVTFEKYKREHVELRDALKRGKAEFADELKSALKKKALGFYYIETKTVTREFDGTQQKVTEKYKKYSPPDVGAIHLLLKNIDDDWRNDDVATLKLKEKKLELDAEKAEAEKW